VTLFSKRYARALGERRLSVSLPRRLRARAWSEMDRRNVSFSYRPDPDDQWLEHSHLLAELEGDLKREYGEDSLMCRNQGDIGWVPCDLAGFITSGKHAQVLDAIELYTELLGKMTSPDARKDFQAEINRIFSEQTAPWRLSDGQFFQVDTEFMAMHLESAQEMLHARGFAGALSELREAQNDLTAGDYKGSIHNACKAYESAMKTILGMEAGSASTLVRKMKEEGYLDDLPESARSSVSQVVLMSLPTLRNKLGGHGQGEEVVSVPRPYAEFAVGLAACLTTLCVEMRTAREGSKESPSALPASAPPDEQLFADKPPF
jgi:hypothetical protein